MRSSDELKERFLEAFVEHRGNTDAARQECGIDRRIFYRWLREDAVFRDRLDSYRILLAEEVEGEAFRRALSSKGSDNLVVTLLRGLRRDRYGEQAQQQVGQVVYISLLRERDRPGVVEDGERTVRQREAAIPGGPDSLADGHDPGRAD